MWKVTRTENQWFKLFSAFTVLHKLIINTVLSINSRGPDVMNFSDLQVFFKVKDMPRNIHVILITVVGINLKKK